jgi:hypothetical protein
VINRLEKEMSFDLHFKIQLYQEVNLLLQKEIIDLEHQILLLKEADEGDGKSSAGDKYETQREMNQQSRNLIQNRFQIAQQRQNFFTNLVLKPQDSIQNLALIQLSSGNFWITFGMGNIHFQNLLIHLISPEAPLFLALKDKKVGDTVIFRGNAIQIQSII